MTYGRPSAQRDDMFATFVAGYFTALSLIAAIGAQNAFVLRQGLRREHVLIVVLTCVISDALLISAGVAGFGHLSQVAPWITTVMLYAGAAFLVVYGALRFKAAAQGGASLMPRAGETTSLARTLGPLLLITWANPHVYLDTVVLIGAISSNYMPAQWVFGTGAIIASISFFFALGYGARLLAPVFASARAWVVLEVVVGITMWVIAASLVLSAGPLSEKGDTLAGAAPSQFLSATP